MSEALSFFVTRKLYKKVLPARRALEFSHGLGQKPTNHRELKLDQCPLLVDSDQKYCAAANDALCHSRPFAPQYDRHKRKDRQRGGLSEIQSGVLLALVAEANT